MRTPRWPPAVVLTALVLAGCAGEADPDVVDETAGQVATSSDEDLAASSPADTDAPAVTDEGASSSATADASEPGTSGDASPPSSSVTHLVEVDEVSGFAFAPTRLEVAVGDTVVWEMVGDERHTVTGSGLNSGVLEPGDTYEVTVTEPGEVEYLCYLHMGMTGTLAVG